MFEDKLKMKTSLKQSSLKIGGKNVNIVAVNLLRELKNHTKMTGITSGYQKYEILDTDFTKSGLMKDIRKNFKVTTNLFQILMQKF